MAGALLFRPKPRWPTAIAFGAAVLIHVAAVGFAAMQQHDVIVEGSDAGPEFSTLILDPPDVSTKLPDDGPSPPPIVDTTDDSFTEPQSASAPVRERPIKSVKPLHRTSIVSPDLTTMSTAKVLALNAPRPEYPYEARRQRITGEGIVALTIDPQSGTVMEVSMWKSTGSPYLDNATTAAFRRWRFKPGSVSKVKAPITFTLMGASY